MTPKQSREWTEMDEQQLRERSPRTMSPRTPKSTIGRDIVGPREVTPRLTPRDILGRSKFERESISQRGSPRTTLERDNFEDLSTSPTLPPRRVSSVNPRFSQRDTLRDTLELRGGRELLHDDHIEQQYGRRQAAFDMYDRRDFRRSEAYPERSERSERTERGYMGGVAAAAYNAKRYDYYMENMEEEHVRLPPRRMVSVSDDEKDLVDPREHYVTLKLHRLNLLEEIQETSLMINLFEQQLLEMEQDTPDDHYTDREMMDDYIPRPPRRPLTLSGIDGSERMERRRRVSPTYREHTDEEIEATKYNSISKKNETNDQTTLSDSSDERQGDKVDDVSKEIKRSRCEDDDDQASNGSKRQKTNVKGTNSDA